MARLQQANPSPETEAAMAYLRVATTLVEEKNAASKSAVLIKPVLAQPI
jgi:hypothetical protein